MNVPSWLLLDIRRRVDRIGVQIERHPDIQALWKEERKRFDAFRLELDPHRKKQFVEWEEKQSFVLSLEKERLYVQGLKDGAQLAHALLATPCLLEHDTRDSGQPPQEYDL